MLKKAVLMVLAAMLIVFGASVSFANQVDGMVSGTGPALPAGIQASLNPGGLGDSLVYGYYNVRGNLDLFNIVNTNTNDGAKVRVVFRNAKNSRECLDFSVCLSKGDVWTAYLIDNGTTAAICPFDTDTLTAPTIPAACQSFKYSGAGGVTGVTADDCREGYFEIVGMVDIPAYDHNVTRPVIANETECRDWVSGGDVDNVLMGNNTIFDVTNLATYSYNATAIADTTLFATSATSAIDAGGFAAIMDNGCSTGEPDYIFTKSSVISPYDIMSILGGETELVLTFPTRLACHGTPDALFNPDINDPKKYCVPIGTTVWDDAEHKLDVSDFSPGLTQCLPHELNVIRIGDATKIWDSTVANIISTGNFDLGWVEIDLTQTGHHVTMDGATALGLPTMGLTTQSFVGGTASYMLPVAYRTHVSLAN